MKIELKNIIKSGLVAGFMIIVIGAGLIPVIGDQMDESLAKLSLAPLSNGAMIFLTIYSLLMGIGIMGFYALIQRVIKTRVKSIVITTILFWFFTYFLSNGALVAYGYIPLKLAVIGTLWGLLEFFGAVIIGSRFLRPKI